MCLFPIEMFLSLFLFEITICSFNNIHPYDYRNYNMLIQQYSSYDYLREIAPLGFEIDEVVKIFDVDGISPTLKQ